jgi:hypothetical protein
MEQGVRFAIREGGRTVGAGVVTKIIAWRGTGLRPGELTARKGGGRVYTDESGRFSQNRPVLAIMLDYSAVPRNKELHHGA